LKEVTMLPPLTSPSRCDVHVTVPIGHQHNSRPLSGSETE